MAKHLVTLEVDDNAMFDMVAQVGDGGAAIGSRLVGLLLAPGSVGLSTSLGMGVYGIALVSVERVEPAAMAADTA